MISPAVRRSAPMKPSAGDCGIAAALLLAGWCCVGSATGLAAEPEQIVIADFETGTDGFPTLWLSSDATEHKVGKASGRIRLGRLPKKYKQQSTPRMALVHKPLAGIAELNREVTSMQFWAKSADIASFEVRLWDGWVNAQTFPVPDFGADGQWHQVTIKLGSAWRSPVTEIALVVPNENPQQEQFLWVDHITATIGAPLPPPLPIPKATRLLNRPLFQPAGGRRGDDTRAYFPSLVKIPDWVPAGQRPDPSAQYYLYWAVHKGGYYIRMSWAADVTGPYREWNPGKGVLRNTDVGLPPEKGDFASPDVHVLPGENKLRMYVHSDSTTYIAESTDGLHWTGVQEPTGEYVRNESYYYRVWPRGEEWFALDRGGNLRRSEDGLHFEKVKRLWWPQPPAPRHVGVFPNPHDPDILEVFVSRLPTQDEHIEMTRLEMSDPDPRNWHLILGYAHLLEPEMDWEGANLPSSISVGSSEPPVRQLRDPYVYSEGGRYYLLYCIQGEQGFGLAELKYPARSANR